MEGFAFFAVWLLAAIATGYLAHRKGRSFGIYFGVAVFLWPLVLPLVLRVSDRSAARALQEYEQRGEPWNASWDGQLREDKRAELEAAADAEREQRAARTQARIDRTLDSLRRASEDRRERKQKDARRRGVWDVVCPVGPDGNRRCARCGSEEFDLRRDQDAGRLVGRNMRKTLGGGLGGFVLGVAAGRAESKRRGVQVCVRCGAGYPVS